MLPIVAWRNVWRNRVRSGVIIAAITLGLVAGIFLVAFSWGINVQRMRDVIETRISHIQIHNPQFKSGQKMKYFLPGGNEMVKSIEQNPSVKAVTGRVLTSGMISSTKGAFGIQIHGVYPDQEAMVTQLPDRIIAGNYFEDDKNNPVLIGDKLADKLGIKKDSSGYNFRKKLVLTFQDASGTTSQARFRVTGIFKSNNSKFDEANIFTKASDIQRIAGIEGEIHEIAVLLSDDKQVAEVKSGLESQYPDAKVEDWGEISPDLKLLADSFGITLYIFMGIILLALAFGIINTMLMAVMERTRELGMLMSIGMNKVKIFTMVMLETIFLALIGGPLGMIIGFILVTIFGTVGIDLSAWAEGVESIGMASYVYTVMEPISYVQIAGMVLLTAVLSAIYPAFKALGLKPAEAVRAI